MSVRHPAYPALLAFGREAVPFVLKRLAEEPSADWAFLLGELTGEWPAYAPEAVGGFAKIDVGALARRGSTGGAGAGTAGEGRPVAKRDDRATRRRIERELDRMGADAVTWKMAQILYAVNGAENALGFVLGLKELKGKGGGDHDLAAQQEVRL